MEVPIRATSPKTLASTRIITWSVHVAALAADSDRPYSGAKLQFTFSRPNFKSKHFCKYHNELRYDECFGPARLYGIKMTGENNIYHREG